MGVIGRARLVQTNAVLIDNLFVHTERLSPGEARLAVQYTLKNYRGAEFAGTAKAEVKKWFPVESRGDAAVATYAVATPGGSGVDSPEYYALDFGPAASPVAPGFERVTQETAYDPNKGFGWEKPKGLTAVDNPQVADVEFVGADLKRDAVEGGAPAGLKLKTSTGMWAFEFQMGSPSHAVDTRVKYINDTVFEFKNDLLHAWEYSPVNATTFIRGGAAVLKFEPGHDGEVFTINALTAMNHVPWTQRFEKSIVLKNPEVWSPESPNLYELRLTIRDEKGVALDDVVVTFGVVTLEDRDGDLYVNNKRYRIRGVLETHSFPPERDDDLYCIAPPDRWIVQDIADNRKANINMMRFHPAEGLGTNYQRWLEYADQMGMFVIWSPRQWFHWGRHSALSYTPLLSANLKPSMIASRNHPSIFAWEGGNETYSNDSVWDERARAFSDAYYDRANSVDPSRFILPISFWYAQFEGRADFYRIDTNKKKELSYPGSGASPRSFWASNVFWDVHPYPGWYGSWAEIWWSAGRGDFYKKDKVFFISEFGAEGMPNWELYRNERYYHAWANSGSSAAKYEKDRLGRYLDFSEWEISQAYQALVMYNNIAVFRTEDADGMAICTGAEGRHNGRYFKGLRDMHRRPKLAYYVTGMAYHPVFAEGLNGDTTLSPADAVEPVIVNEGPAQIVDLEVVFHDLSGSVVYREKLTGLRLPETRALRTGRKVRPRNLKSGKYYYVEYVVTDSKNEKKSNSKK